jgi:hypothetical protein
VLSPRNSIETHRRFGEKHCLHPQGTEISKATNTCFFIFLLLGLLVHAGDGDDTSLRNVGGILQDYMALQARSLYYKVTSNATNH